MKKTFSKLILLVAMLSPILSHAGEKYTDAKFEDLLKNKKNILVHVHADWCPTCKVQKKNLAKINTDGFVNIEVSFDKDKNFIKNYKVLQQSTFIAFADGQEVGRKMGITKQEDIQSFIATSFPADDSLQSVLDKKRSESKAPEQARKTMQDATAKLEKSGIIAKATKKGDKFIDFELPNAKGGKLKLSKALKEGPVILTFYRGGWCPYCNLQLRAYQESLGEFKKKGVRLIAITPETAQSADSTVDKNKLEFDVLTDTDNRIATKYGLVFQIEDDLKDIYQKFGIDLEKNQNNKLWKLPIPATYVINKKGEVVYSFLNVDYTQRAEPSEIIKAL